MVNPATVTANANEGEGGTQPRKIPRIKKQDVRRNIQGAFCYSSWFIRLPINLVFQDLNDHQSEIWRDTQKDRNTALGRFDNVRLVSADEAWFADGVVVEANIDKVVLGALKRIQLAAPTDVFTTHDGLYKVEWLQLGYGVFHRSNEQWVPMSALGYYPTLERAKHELMTRCYQKNVR